MKVKEKTQRDKEKENQLDWSFAEWLESHSNKLTQKDIDDMESVNNSNYYPQQGA